MTYQPSIDVHVADLIRATTGWTVSVDYPGFLTISFGARHDMGERAYIAGDANATWSADYYERLEDHVNGEHPAGDAGTNVPTTETDPAVIAAALVDAITRHETHENSVDV